MKKPRASDKSKSARKLKQRKPDARFEDKLKVRFNDLLNAGIVGSRFDLHHKIRKGALRPPFKDGNSQQASAWWYRDDVLADLAKERAALTGEAA
jgi:D-Tyr-tRNAtyr deacylase